MNMRVVCIVILGTLAISGCTATEGHTSVEERIDQVAQCEANQILEPRTCRLSCASGLISLKCSKQCGSGVIARPNNVEMCHWESPWEGAHKLTIEISHSGNIEPPDACSDSSVSEGGKSVSFGVGCTAYWAQNVPNRSGSSHEGSCDNFLLSYLNRPCLSGDNWEDEFKY